MLNSPGMTELVLYRLPVPPLVPTLYPIKALLQLVPPHVLHQNRQ